jgi:stage III sporulation protein AH
MKNKEKIKKIGIAVLSFCFMISIAGYINYKYNPEREKDLGQTVYVNSNNDSVEIYKETDSVFNSNDDKITSFKNDRDNMYSELANNYSQIINNSNSSTDTISEYQQKLSSLIEEKNQVLMVENLIKSKGVEDVVIVLTNSQKANIIIKTQELSESLAAQIMQIVVDQLNIDANDITIENINT